MLFQLAKKYPNSVVDAEMAASAPPTLTICPEALIGIFQGYIAAYVTSNGTRTYAFNITVVSIVVHVIMID